MNSYKTHRGNYWLFLIAISILSGCASTQLISSWSDTSYKNQIHKILVLGMARNESIKRTYESTLVATLNEAGAQAEAAGSMIPEGAENNPDALKAALAGKDFDTILVTRMVSKRNETYFVPDQTYHVPYPYYNRFNNYYMNAYPAVYGPGYLATDTIVNLETNIYELTDGKLVWAVTSETFNPNDINKVVVELSQLFVKQLKKDGLLPS